ncbi:MAG: hypothetical protein EXQ70_04015 [Solirubrobacterales bacterium]|nr:hypothetical protein [Solirubrobacterales bacterium]
MTQRTLRISIAVLAVAIFAIGALGASAGAKKPKKHPKDADHDALPYKWETGNTPTGLNLKKWKASPGHRDIFVQLDFQKASLRQALPCGELDALYNAFASAPLTNPDGKKGIRLHLDAGKTCPSRKYDLGGSKLFNVPDCASQGQVFLADQLAAKRVGAFHISGIYDGCSGGEGGAATFLGVQSVVSTDSGSIDHVLMHELGHNLGLDHMSTPQPNRLSVMTTRLFTSTTGSGPTPVLDYQRFDIPALDESQLSEPAGLGTAAAHKFFVRWSCPPASLAQDNSWPGDANVDWNCNSPSPFPMDLTIDPDPVQADINRDGDMTDVFPATHNEWPTLQLRSGGQIGP